MFSVWNGYGRYQQESQQSKKVKDKAKKAMVAKKGERRKQNEPSEILTMRVFLHLCLACRISFLCKLLFQSRFRAEWNVV